MFYKNVVRPTLFSWSRRDPEDAHELALDVLEWASNREWALNLIRKQFYTPTARLERTVMGITFPNPVGLAAGFTKDGFGASALAALGFGFLELGTVTPPPQEGNTRPRMFRLEEDLDLINRMGFNNRGAGPLAKKRKTQGKLPVPVGISLGKAKDTPLEDAAADYVFCLRALYDYGDYFVVNVSSPNTKDLRQLQGKELLLSTLRAVILEARRLAGERRNFVKPVLVKIAPDLTFPQVDDVLDVCAQLGILGLIASNTTLGRESLSSPHQKEVGGLSGRTLFERTEDMVPHIRKQDPKITIIASGGIFYGWQARSLLDDLGADLLQIWTGLVYEGPSVVKNILTHLAA